MYLYHSKSNHNLTPIVYTANGFHSMDLQVRYVWISLAAPTDRPPSEMSWSRPFTRTVGWRLSVFCRQIMSSDCGNITSSALCPVKDSTTAAWHSLFLFPFLCFAFLLASFRLLLTPLFLVSASCTNTLFSCLVVFSRLVITLGITSTSTLTYVLVSSTASGASKKQASKAHQCIIGGGGGGGSKTFTCSSWGGEGAKKVILYHWGGYKKFQTFRFPICQPPPPPPPHK